MKLSTKERYSLSAMIELAEVYSQNIKIKAKDIAQNQKIPLQYLEQILLKLKRKNLILATKGPGGGYVLAKKPSSINVHEIIVESPSAIVGCLISKKSCVRSDLCKARPFWHKLNAKLSDILINTTLDELL
jgi:Rrf2 family protein